MTLSYRVGMRWVGVAKCKQLKDAILRLRKCKKKVRNSGQWVSLPQGASRVLEEGKGVHSRDCLGYKVEKLGLATVVRTRAWRGQG